MVFKIIDFFEKNIFFVSYKMERFSIPKLIDDVNKYVECRDRFERLKKKRVWWIVGNFYKNKVERAYKDLINQMKILEVKYNPKHPIYQNNHFNQNINTKHPNLRLEYNRPPPITLHPSAPPYQEVANNYPFVHH